MEKAADFFFPELGNQIALHSNLECLFIGMLPAYIILFIPFLDEILEKRTLADSIFYDFRVMFPAQFHNHGGVGKVFPIVKRTQGYLGL